MDRGQQNRVEYMSVTMTSRDRFRRAIAHQEHDRVPLHDAPWNATLALWKQQGMPADVTAFDYFGYDIRTMSANLTPRLPIHRTSAFTTSPASSLTG